MNCCIVTTGARDLYVQYTIRVATAYVYIALKIQTVMLYNSLTSIVALQMHIVIQTYKYCMQVFRMFVEVTR